MFMQFLITLLLVNAVPIKSGIINSKVTRIIDVQTQLVKINAKIEIQNWGLKYVDKFTYVLDPDVQEVYINFKSEKNHELSFENTTNQCRNDADYCNNYDVLLDKQLAPNHTYVIKAEVIYIDKIVPLYKTRTFVQDHYVSYSGNLLFYSPYKTLLSKTTYIWKKLIDLEVSHPPHFQNNNSISYSYTYVVPFSIQNLEMEFQNNEPFLVVTNLVRIIDVSHFGKIFVEDRIHINNEGSKLVGPYEHRLSEMEQRASGWMYTHLPVSAQDVQYFDTIGKSTKSVVMHFRKHKTFKFQPRHPLLSGWKTFYVVQYTVPTYEYLYHDHHGTFALKMRVVDHILNDIVLKQTVTKILLPEGAKILHVSVPFGFKRLENEMQYTDLSSFGRPTIVVSSQNIAESHIADVKIIYLFPSIYLLRAPLMIIFYLYLMFNFYIVASRIKNIYFGCVM